jgi:transcriptional regulator with XRE-family HTH domain
MARRRSATHAALSRRVQIAFGRRLKASRKRGARGKIKQDALADVMEVSRTTISNMERGQHRVFLDQVYAVAGALGVSINDLLPSVEEVFPGTQVTTSSGSAITGKSMRSVVDLVRTIQERAAVDYAAQNPQSSKRPQSRRS